MWGWVFDIKFIISETIICRKYKCFKRDKESEEEDLTISTQFQQFLDDMSTDEESDISLSNDSENDLNEVDLFHDDEDYYYLWLK